MKRIFYLAMIATLLLSVAAVAVPTDAELAATSLELRHLDLNVRTHLVNAAATQFTNVCISENILGFPIPWYCFDVKFCDLWGIVNCIQVGPTNCLGKADTNYFLQASVWKATAFGQKKGLLFWKCESDPVAILVAYKPGFYAAGELVWGCGKQFALSYITPTPIGPGPAQPLGDPGSGFLYLDPACHVQFAAVEFNEVTTVDSTIVFRGFGAYTFQRKEGRKTKTICCTAPFDVTIFQGLNGPEFALNIYEVFPGAPVYQACGLIWKGGVLIL